jgi:hypothetical protein
LGIISDLRRCDQRDPKPSSCAAIGPRVGSWREAKPGEIVLDGARTVRPVTERTSLDEKMLHAVGLARGDIEVCKAWRGCRRR